MDRLDGFITAALVAAAMNANVWDQGEAIEALLAARRVVDPAVLAEPETDLTRLVGADPDGGSDTP